MALKEDVEIRRYSGPLHGIVMRLACNPGTPEEPYYIRGFNSRPELGYCDGEYQGVYSLTFVEACIRFDAHIKRVQAPGGTGEGDLRVLLEKLGISS